MLALKLVRLGQLPSVPYHVVVADPRGAPWKGATVTIGDVSRVTDGNGVASFESVPAGYIDARIKIGEFTVDGKGSSDNTLFVTVPICAEGPLLTNTELVALVTGGALAAGGYYLKKDLLSKVGELVFGASIFTIVYRHSCRW